MKRKLIQAKPEPTEKSNEHRVYLPTRLAFGDVPGDNHPIAFAEDGSVLTVFGEKSWNLTPYNLFGKHSAIRFPFWKDTNAVVLQTQLNFEARRILYLLLQKHRNKGLKLSTLANYASALSTMGTFAFAKDVTLLRILSNRTLSMEYAAAYPAQARKFITLLTLVREAGSEKIGCSMMTNHDVKILKASIQLAAKPDRQHPPVPFRILSSLIQRLTDFLEDYEKVEDAYLEVVRLCSADTITGRSFSAQEKSRLAGRSAAGETGESLRSILARHSLISFFKKHKLRLDMKGLAKGLMKVRSAVKCLIHAYSGIRDIECSSLPLDCMEMSVAAGKSHFLIAGDTTKFAPEGINATRWVTCAEGHWAIERQRKISEVIYEYNLGNEFRDTAKDQTLYLFVGPSYFPLFGGLRPEAAGMVFTGQKSDTQDIEEFIPTIEEGDLIELERVDTLRAWRSEEAFKAGARWPLTSHQLRRSLALYAHRSGLVSLPSLRRQLKHLTEAMSLYYAKGSAFATNFIGKKKDHFGIQWREEQALHDALSYEFNVLNRTDELVGPHVLWIKAALVGDDGKLLIDRANTIKKFEKGEMAYKETSLGGCVATDRCEHTSLEFFRTECVKGCANFVGNREKIQDIITAQARFVARLDPNSIEARTELRELETLRAALD